MLALALLGLAPVAELVDTVEVVAGVHAGEMVAGESCATDCSDGCEKSGCHAGVHHCGCCAPMPRIASDSALVVHLPVDAPTWRLYRARAPPSEEEAPPRQPPKA